MSLESNLQKDLAALRQRRPDGLQVVVAVSGIELKRLNEIADGVGAPINFNELITLESLVSL